MYFFLELDLLESVVSFKVLMASSRDLVVFVDELSMSCVTFTEVEFGSDEF